MTPLFGSATALGVGAGVGIGVCRAGAATSEPADEIAAGVEIDRGVPTPTGVGPRRWLEFCCDSCVDGAEGFEIAVCVLNRGVPERTVGACAFVPVPGVATAIVPGVAGSAAGVLTEGRIAPALANLLSSLW